MLGRWDEAVTAFWRALEAWNDAGAHAAGYGLRGFLPAIDLGRARGDGRIEMAASQAITSVLSRLPASSGMQRLHAYLKGDAGFTDDDPAVTGLHPAEMVERRLNLANDNRQVVPDNVMEQALQRGVRYGIPLLEAQARRSIGLSRRDASELSNAIEIWERIGAVPLIGRARAERGLVTSDNTETEAGLAILRKLGDVNYVDRFSTEL
jgi:hypothetical protein